MLVQFVYCLWALLPICLGLVALKAVFKKFSDTPKQESVKYFLKQALLCAVLLVLTIWLDKLFVNDMLVQFLGGKEKATIVMFLEYPLMLLAFGTLQKHFKDDRTRGAELERKRLHRAVWTGQ